MRRVFKNHIINKLLLISLILVIIPGISKAQRSFDSKFFTGGNLGLQIGTVTLIDVSPIIGYRLTEDIDIGVGLTYKYYNNKNYLQYFNNYYGVESNIYGGSLFARYHITEAIFAHVEVEDLEYSFNDYIIYPTSLVTQKKTVEVPGIFVGIGYRQKLGENSYLTIMLLYNLNETHYSPYTNPLLKVGYTIGF